MDKDRPAGQRKVSSETTKDKAEALPSAVYYTQPPHTKVMFNDDSTMKVEKELNKLRHKSRMAKGTRMYPASRLCTVARLK